MIFSTESKDWKIIVSTKGQIKAELIKNELESNEIACIIINRKDSNYPLFGRYDLYVPTAKQSIAKVIVDLFLEKDDV